MRNAAGARHVAAQPNRVRIPHRVVRQRIAGGEAVLILHPVGAPHEPVVRERIRLDEARRVGRIPCPGQVLPLAVNGPEELESIGQVLGNRDLEGAIVVLAPRVVGHAVQEPAVRIHEPESAERLVRPCRIDPVDVHLRVLLFVDLDDARYVHTRLARELTPEADRELVEQRLMQLSVELLRGNRRRPGRGHDDSSRTHRRRWHRTRHEDRPRRRHRMPPPDAASPSTADGCGRSCRAARSWHHSVSR